MEHRALTTHNDAVRHWNGDHGTHAHDFSVRVRRALDEYYASPLAYVDVHAWYFTPDTFRSVVTLASEASGLGLRVDRVYATRRFSNEFWVILRKLDRPQ
jgi:hypothetical protein